MDPFFFGYGSLVNRATHVYSPAYRARLAGWRRTWRHTDHRNAPYLTAIPCENSIIDGLVALVPGGDWAALDQREVGYDRHPLASGLAVEGDQPVAAQIYAVPVETAVSPVEKPAIWLSYLDVVLQGYLREFGEEGAQGFMATTDGWDTPVRDDRARPAYPRHQVLTPAERGFVDAALRAQGVLILRD
ncbi:MAG: gamma-glutamylcyclotransferase family protein [Paracoccaceae bacterium]